MRRLPVVILLGAVIAGLAGVWSVRAGASQAGFQAPGGYYTSQKEVQAARLVKDGVPRFALDIITFGIHDGTNFHLDALCHYRVMRDGQWEVFNGHPQK